MDHNSATVPVDCETCGSQATGEVYETIIGRRLHWVMDHPCPTGDVEAMGWDETPDEWRQALLHQCGTYRLRLNGELTERIPVWRVLRRAGLTLAAIDGEGLAGTEAELELLAARLRDAGAAVSVVSGA
jgi:hypothetical protein